MPINQFGRRVAKKPEPGTTFKPLPFMQRFETGGQSASWQNWQTIARNGNFPLQQKLQQQQVGSGSTTWSSTASNNIFDKFRYSTSSSSSSSSSASASSSSSSSSSS